MSQREEKFRVSLSLAQLKWTAMQARQAPTSPMSLEVYRIMQSASIKAEVGAINPAFSAAAKQPASDWQENDQQKYDRLLQLDFSNLSEADKIWIREYRYLNNLMDEEEEAAYEQSGQSNSG